MLGSFILTELLLHMLESFILTELLLYMLESFILTELLLHMPDSADRLKNLVAELFEDWWRLGLEGRFDLVTNTIIYLLEKSVSTRGVRFVLSLERSLHVVLY
jgi:hypothetical protein